MSVVYIKECFEDFCNWFTKTPEERQAIRIMRAVKKAQQEQGHVKPPRRGRKM